MEEGKAKDWRYKLLTRMLTIPAYIPFDGRATIAWEEVDTAQRNSVEEKAVERLPIPVAEPSTVHEATVAASVAGYADRAGDRRKLFGRTKR